MEFASKFVFNYSDSDEESVSDDEFQNGMCVSDSGSDDDLEEPKSDTVEAATVSPGAPKGKSLGEAIWSRLSRGGGKATKKRLPAKPTSHWRSAHYVSPETRETSERAVHKKRFRRADTNVVSIKFETLIAPSHMHTGDTVYCGKCKAILSHISKLRDKDGNRVWECEFCSEHESVDVDDAEIPATEDVTYMLEPAPSTTASGPSGTDQSLVIFCVDVSGSMCVTTEVPGHVNLRGNQLERMQSWNTLHEDQHLPRERRNVTYISRLQAMQAAVDHQIQELVRDFPHRRAALIAFNNEVSVLGDGTQDPVCIAGDKLRDREVLSKTGSEIQIPKSVQQSRAAISEKIFALEEGGATALGPALTVAVAMASKCPGSKVIVCTDGMANVGLGSLENQNSETETEAVEDFYSGLGESALASSVSISVVSITGSDCKLAQLGRVAEFTGGQVNIVDPLKLTQEFSTILADRVIATNVVATFLLHKGLYLRNEEGSDSKAVRVVGNVSADTEITFEYGIRRDNKKKQPTTSEPKIADVSGEADAGGEGGASGSSAGRKVAEAPKEYPFQLQIQYTDTEGAKALRVITQSRPVTTQRKLAEKEVNLAVLGTHTAQTSSRLALAGEYTKSRGLALMNQRLAWRKGQDDKSSKAKYKDYFGRIKGLENGVNFMQQKEISTRGTTYSDEDSDVDEVDEKKKKQKRKKKKIQRSAACSDVTYEAMYDMTHGNIDKFLKKE